MAEHEEHSLQESKQCQEGQDITDYPRFLSRSNHPMQHSKYYQLKNTIHIIILTFLHQLIQILLLILIQQIQYMKTHSQPDFLLIQATTDPNSQRNHKIRSILLKEKLQLIQEVEDNVQKIINDQLRSHSDKPNFTSEKLDQIHQVLQMFLSSSQKMTQTYFCMVSSTDSIELCTEKMLTEKVNDFKASILRSAKNMELRVREIGNDNIRVQRRSVRKSKSNPNSLQKSHILVRWLLENFQNPYPTKLQKQKMIQDTGLSLRQINNWFINVRERTVKKYLRKQQKQGSSDQNQEGGGQSPLLNSPTFIMPENIVKEEEC